MALDSHAAHRFVQWVLRGGLALATLLLAVGLALALASGDHTAVPIRLHDVLSEGATSDRLISIGLVLLAFTPVVRVLALVVIWSIERDRKFVLVGLVVIAVLGTAIATGRG